MVKAGEEEADCRNPRQKNEIKKTEATPRARVNNINNSGGRLSVDTIRRELQNLKFPPHTALGAGNLHQTPKILTIHPL